MKKEKTRGNTTETIVRKDTLNSNVDETSVSSKMNLTNGMRQENSAEFDAAEAELFELIALDPRKPESRETFKLNERAIVTMTRLHQAAFCKMYKIKGYWIDPEKKSFPLKAVCALGASLDTIKAVFKLNPEASFDALCECPFSNYPLAVVQFLVQSNPKALDQADEAGRTVLHYCATCKNISKDIIQYMVSRNEARLLVKTTKGSTPLHLACCSLMPLKNIRFFVDTHGDVLKLKNNDGCTPIYIACSEQTALDVLQYFTECCPTSLEITNVNGFTPLHVACSSPKVSMETVEFLVSKNANVLAIKAGASGGGRTPLHIAASRKGFPHLVGFLAEKGQSTLLIFDDHGDTPTHVACAVSDTETVKVLLDCQAEWKSLKSADGLTPFVAACESSNLPVVTFLADLYPEVVSCKDEETGWYPLHQAASAGKKAALNYLYEKYPEAAGEVDKAGRTPLALFACRADCDIVIVHKLLSKHLHTIKIMDHDGNHPLNHDQKDALIHLFLQSTSIQI